MILPRPNPRGVVLFAGRNSRRREYAAYLLSAGWARAGYLKRCRPPRPLPAWCRAGGHVFYEIESFNGHGTGRQVAMSGRPDRTGENHLYDPATGATVGRARREDVVNATDVRQMKNDSTGMFRPVAHTFRQLYGSQIEAFENVHDDFDEDGHNERDTRENFFEAVDNVAVTGLDFFAYSGHGSARGLPSAGISTTANGRTDRGFTALVAAIRRLCRADGWVLLYACSTADPGGFAEKLSGALPRMTVFGHRQAARGDVNPRKYRIVGGRSVAVQSELPADVRELWTAAALERENLYARYPFLSIAQIADELRGG
jgi:hypothetical protein